MRISDWSSDVCSSDLLAALRGTAAVDADLESMQALADRIAEGEEVVPAFEAPGAATPGSTPVEAEVDAEAEAEAEAVEAAAAQAGEGMLPASEDALLRSEEHTSEIQSLMRN